MPQRYNAASEIVLPAPQNSALDETLGEIGDHAEVATAIAGFGPGQTIMAGLELGIEATLADPDAGRKVLAYIDSAKAEHSTLDSTISNAEQRAQFMQELIDAANGIKLIAPPQPPGTRDWTN
jgi:hypothetical protein